LRALLLALLATLVAHCKVSPQAFLNAARRSHVGRVYTNRKFCTGLRAHPPATDGFEEDPWEVLGLSPKATHKEVKARFKQLVRMYHPDVCLAGSGHMMKRVISAAEAILDTLPKEPRAPAKKPPKRASRYERKKAKEEAERTSEEMKHRLLYKGRSRLHGSKWWDYRITLSEIEISYPLAPYMRQIGAEPKKVVKYQDVRYMTSYFDLGDGRCDLELELLIRTRLKLEQLPSEVCAHVAQSVRTVQLQREARRARLVRR